MIQIEDLPHLVMTLCHTQETLTICLCRERKKAKMIPMLTLTSHLRTHQDSDFRLKTDISISIHFNDHL